MLYMKVKCNYCKGKGTVTEPVWGFCPYCYMPAEHGFLHKEVSCESCQHFNKPANFSLGRCSKYCIHVENNMACPGWQEKEEGK